MLMRKANLMLEDSAELCFSDDDFSFDRSQSRFLASWQDPLDVKKGRKRQQEKEIRTFSEEFHLVPFIFSVS